MNNRFKYGKGTKTYYITTLKSFRHRAFGVLSIARSGVHPSLIRHFLNIGRTDKHFGQKNDKESWSYFTDTLIFFKLIIKRIFFFVNFFQKITFLFFSFLYNKEHGNTDYSFLI